MYWKNFALFHSDGKVTLSTYTDRLKILQGDSTRTGAATFKSFEEIRSRPTTFFVKSEFRVSRTDLTEILCNRK